MPCLCRPQHTRSGHKTRPAVRPRLNAGKRWTIVVPCKAADGAKLTGAGLRRGRPRRTRRHSSTGSLRSTIQTRYTDGAHTVQGRNTKDLRVHVHYAQAARCGAVRWGGEMEAPQPSMQVIGQYCVATALNCGFEEVHT